MQGLARGHDRYGLRAYFLRTRSRMSEPQAVLSAVCRLGCRPLLRLADNAMALVMRAPARAMVDSDFSRRMSADRYRSRRRCLQITTNACSYVCRSLQMPASMSAEPCRCLQLCLQLATNACIYVCRSLQIAADACRSLQMPADRYRAHGQSSADRAACFLLSKSVTRFFVDEGAHERDEIRSPLHLLSQRATAPPAA